MKNFIYKEIKHHNRTRNNRELTIYRIKNNIPEYIGTFVYSTASTRGAQHEVFNYLMNNGYIPKNITHRANATGGVRGIFSAKSQKTII